MPNFLPKLGMKTNVFLKFSIQQQITKFRSTIIYDPGERNYFRVLPSRKKIPRAPRPPRSVPGPHIRQYRRAILIFLTKALITNAHTTSLLSQIRTHARIINTRVHETCSDKLLIEFYSQHILT